MKNIKIGYGGRYRVKGEIRYGLVIDNQNNTYSLVKVLSTDEYGFV